MSRSGPQHPREFFHVFSLCFEQIPSQRADKLFIFAHYPQNQQVKQWSNQLLAHASSSSCNMPWAKHTHTHPGTSSIAPALILRVRFGIRVRHPWGHYGQVLATNPRQLNRLTTESPLRPVIKLPNYNKLHSVKSLDVAFARKIQKTISWAFLAKAVLPVPSVPMHNTITSCRKRFPPLCSASNQAIKRWLCFYMATNGIQLPESDSYRVSKYLQIVTCHQQDTHGTSQTIQRLRKAADMD